MIKKQILKSLLSIDLKKNKTIDCFIYSIKLSKNYFYNYNFLKNIFKKKYLK